MFSTFSWLCICFVLLIIKYGFIKPVEDKKLFRLYEARDNVAFAAVEGKISQDANEYKFVIESVNVALYYMKNNYDFSLLINYILFEPKKAKKYFDDMVKLVEEYDFLEKNYHISRAYFQRSISIRFFFFMYLVIKPFCIILSLLIFLLNIGKRLTEFSKRITNVAEERIRIMSEISEAYYSYKKSYAK